MDDTTLPLLTTELLGALIVGVLAVIAWATGRAVLRRLELELDSALEDIAVSTTIGLGAFASVLFLLGVLGALRPLPVLVAAAVLTALSLAGWRPAFPLQPTEMRLLGVGALALLPALALTLFPPTFHDAVAYHLPYASAFAESGALPVLWHLRFPIFPQLGELLFAMPLLVGSDTGALMLSLLATALCALLLFVWGSRFGWQVGLFSAAVWLGIPFVHWYAVSAYIEPMLALFTVAALYCWERWHAKGGESWLMAAGLAAGFAAATKYLGLPVVLGLAVATLWQSWRGLERARWAPLLRFALPAVLVAIPWYVRIAVHTSNPVFPFFSWVFGTQGGIVTTFEWSDGSGAHPTWWSYLGHQLATAVEGVGILLRLPWMSYFAREAFAYQAPLSPWLQLVPVAFLVALWSAPTRRVLAWCLLLLAFWSLSYRPYHLLLPTFALCSLLVGFLLFLAATKLFPRSRRLPYLLAGILAVGGPAYGIHKLVELGPLPITVGARHEYRAKELPGYGAIRWLDRNDPTAIVYGLFAPTLHHAARGRLRGDFVGGLTYEEILAERDAESLARALLERDIDYLLVVDPPGRSAVPAELSSSPYFELVYSAVDADLYRLLRLSGREQGVRTI